MERTGTFLVNHGDCRRRLAIASTPDGMIVISGDAAPSQSVITWSWRRSRRKRAPVC